MPSFQEKTILDLWSSKLFSFILRMNSVFNNSGWMKFEWFFHKRSINFWWIFHFTSAFLFFDIFLCNILSQISTFLHFIYIHKYDKNLLYHKLKMSKDLSLSFHFNFWIFFVLTRFYCLLLQQKLKHFIFPSATVCSHFFRSIYFYCFQRV